MTQATTKATPKRRTTQAKTPAAGRRSVNFKPASTMQPINRRRTVSKVAIQERNTKPAKVPVSNLDMPEEDSVLRLQATGEQLKRLRYTKTDLVLYSALTAIFFLVVIIGIIVWR